MPDKVPQIEVKLKQPVLIVDPQKTTKEKTTTIKKTKENDTAENNNIL